MAQPPVYQGAHWRSIYVCVCVHADVQRGTVSQDTNTQPHNFTLFFCLVSSPLRLSLRLCQVFQAPQRKMEWSFDLSEEVVWRCSVFTSSLYLIPSSPAPSLLYSPPHSVTSPASESCHMTHTLRSPLYHTLTYPYLRGPGCVCMKKRDLECKLEFEILKVDKREEGWMLHAFTSEPASSALL